MNIRNLTVAAFTAVLLLISHSVSAQQPVNGEASIASEHRKRIKAATEIAALGTDAFGNQTSESTGKTVFVNVDISLPGNSALPVQFGRRLPIEPRYITEELGGLGNWDIDVPYIEGSFSKSRGWTTQGATLADRLKRCSYPGWPDDESLAIDPEDFFSGYNIHVPGVVSEPMLQELNNYTDPTDGQVYPWILTNMARISCLPTVKNGYPGEGFLLKLTDGTKYYFDYPVERNLPDLRKGPKHILGLTMQRKRVFLLASRIEDRYGNYVDYQYSNGLLTRIIANDGRQIDVSYGGTQGGHPTVTATANGRSWVYTIENGHLRTLTNPDGSWWRYPAFGTYAARSNTPEQEMPSLEYFSAEDQCMAASMAEYVGSFAFEVRHPSGATSRFDFTGNAFFRSYTPYWCEVDWVDSEASNGTFVPGYAHIRVPNWYPAFSLVKTTVQGLGITPQVTSVEYPVEHYPYCDFFDSQTGTYSGPRCYEDPCQGYGCDSTGRWVVVTLPSGDKIRKRFGVRYGVNEGLLLNEEILDASGQVVRTAERNYYYGNLPDTQAFKKRIGGNWGTDPMIGLQMPLTASRIDQDGATFRSEVQLCGAIYCFDDFARQTKVRRYSSLGYTRTDATEYHDDLSLWVLGQTKRLQNLDTGMTESEASYNALAQLVWAKKFGKLQHSLTYRTDGQIATVADGRNNVTTFNDYFRGIPRQIVFPATAEAPAGATQAATVDANGWVTSVTDEVGAITGYGYDAMGRLAGIVYPTGDAVAYNNTLRSFRALTDSDWKPAGIATGQWRQYEETGSRVKISYLDALWRPVIVHEYDAGNVANTLRAVRYEYDTDGRVSFESYPSSANVPGAQGTRKFYDALDRTTRVEQDSEQGTLITTTQYLSGLRTLATNPRGHQTTTSFMAWDQPSYDLPVLSEQPENKVVQIARHPRFGWPLALTQREADNSLSLTRSYVYDGYAQLCKMIEPETGATVTGYDAAGNLAWSATGLTGANYASTSDCSYVEANASGRVASRTYDARNRLTTLSFPDGRGNQAWTYEKDGLPASISVWNDSATTGQVTTAYTYNKRRLLAGESIHQNAWYTWAIGYSYDANGNLASQTYPTGLNIDYAPNALGQATKAGTYATGASYYPNGALKQFTYGNGIVHTMTQNARQLPLRVTSSGNVLDFEYGYDENANTTNILDHVSGTPTAQHRWMTYDGLDRLTTAASAMFGGSDQTHRFTYDALDNLKSWKLAGVKDYADYIYDAQNRLASIRNTGGATVVGLTYDAQGNLSNKNGQAYDFDFGNRLRNVQTKESYRYDGEGRRVQTTAASGGATTLWQYAKNGQVLFSSSWDGPNYLNQQTREYVHLAGSTVAIIDHSWPSNAVLAVKYQHTDALGSPVAVTNAAGQVVERLNYEPYGPIIGNPNRSGVGYTGHIMDGATGLTYMQQRYYDQSVGRFLSVDPVTALDNGDMRHFNRYVYAYNNPYKFTDPDGRCPVCIRLIIQAIRGAPKIAPRAAPKAAPRSAPRSAQETARAGGEQAAKRGPKTDPNAPHNATIRREADKLESQGNEILAGGGRKPERLVPTPGGNKDGRRPDILYRTPEGEVRATNVGRTNADGTPVKREVKAMDDLNRAGVKTEFKPYDR